MVSTSLLSVKAVTLGLKSSIKDLRIFLTILGFSYTSPNLKRKVNYVIQFGIELIKSLFICHSNALKPRGQLLQFINFYCFGAFMHSLLDISSNMGYLHIRIHLNSSIEIALNIAFIALLLKLVASF